MSSSSIIKMAKREGQGLPGENLYEWKSGCQVKADPDVAMEVFQAISDRDGSITAPAVLEEASHPLSPLHRDFEWNDTAAANAHRLAQAGHLVRSLTIRIRREDNSFTPPTRAIVNVQPFPEDVEPPSYRRGNTQHRHFIPVRAALSEPEQRAMLLRQAVRELQVYRRRYRDMAELVGLFDAVWDLEKKVGLG